MPQCWKRSPCDACVQCAWVSGVHVCAASAVLHVRSARVDVQRMYARVRARTAHAARVCTYSNACGCAQRVGMGERRANRQQCWGEEGGAPPWRETEEGSPPFAPSGLQLVVALLATSCGDRVGGHKRGTCRPSTFRPGCRVFWGSLVTGSPTYWGGEK